MGIEEANELERRNVRVSREHVLEGWELSVAGHLQELVAECGVHILTLVVHTPVLLALMEEFLLVEGDCTHQDGGSSTGVSQAEKGYRDDKRVLHRCQDEAKGLF